LFSNFILELEPKFSKNFIRIKTRYSNKIEIKPSLILKKKSYFNFFIIFN
jgi:hypothetical protein